MAEGQGADELFLGGAELLGCGHHRHCHGNALIAGAGIAHGGEGASGHTGVRSRRGHGHAVGQEPLAEDVAVDIVLYRASYLESVGTGQSLLCEGPVHPGGVQQEGDVLQTGLLSGEVEDLPHIQMIVESGLVRCRLLSGCCGSLSRRR